MKRARDPNDTPVVNKIGKTEDAKGKWIFICVLHRLAPYAWLWDYSDFVMCV